jgi:hypothetical protein
VPATTTPYALGSVIGASGANAGQTRTIAGFASGSSLSVKLAFLSAPAPGDTFQILPGCDRSQRTCFSTFQNTRADPSGSYNAANADRFGGFPYVPPPEDAI